MAPLPRLIAAPLDRRVRPIRNSSATPSPVSGSVPAASGVKSDASRNPVLVELPSSMPGPPPFSVTATGPPCVPVRPSSGLAGSPWALVPASAEPPADGQEEDNAGRHTDTEPISAGAGDTGDETVVIEVPQPAPTPGGDRAPESGDPSLKKLFWGEDR